MSEAFAASVRALEMRDDVAPLTAMGRGELLAQVREYERAEAVAPVDVRPQIDLSDAARQDSLARAEKARQAENEAQATAAEDLTRRLNAHRDGLQVADAARCEWEEATAAKAEAGSQARAELKARGPARWDEHRPQAEAAEAREVQADEPGAETQAEAAAGIDKPELGPEIERAEPVAEAETGAWPEAQAEMTADVDPEALTVMASADADMAAISRSEFDDNLARAQAGAEQLAAQRARDQAERDRAAIDEPVSHVEADAGLEAAADKAEVEDAGLEI